MLENTASNNIRERFQARILEASARLKPIETRTREILGSTTEKLKTPAFESLRPSLESFRKVEESLRAQVHVADLAKKLSTALQGHVDLSAIAGRIQSSPLTIKLNQLLHEGAQRLNLSTGEEVEGLRSELTELRKQLNSVERRLTRRVQKKDLKSVVSRLEKLEKNRTA